MIYEPVATSDGGEDEFVYRLLLLVVTSLSLHLICPSPWKPIRLTMYSNCENFSFLQNSFAREKFCGACVLTELDGSIPTPGMLGVGVDRTTRADGVKWFSPLGLPMDRPDSPQGHTQA
jgi:hypothetical protein